MDGNSTAHQSSSQMQPTGILNPGQFRKWILAAALLFLVASIFGALMRLFWLVEIPFLDYRHILHAHSHVAQLGWGFLLVTAALLVLGLSESSHRKRYLAVLVLNVVACFGMAAAFLYQGYGPISIGFSVLHLFVAYYFAWWYWKDLKHAREKAAAPLLRASLIWMVIASLGLWFLPVVIQVWGKTSALYHMSVQWFLHLQFNGWFTYAMLGLLITWVNRQGGSVKLPTWVCWVLHLSVILTYALSVSWTNPNPALFYLNGLGVVLQFIAIGYILLAVMRSYDRFWSWKTMGDSLVAIGVVSLVAKVVMQSTLIVPAMAEVSHTIRNFIIGFIHLTMLGSITMTVAGLLIKDKIIPQTGVLSWGWGLLILGFVLTEVLLFSQGLWVWIGKGFFPYYHEILFAFTLILPISILIICIGFAKSAKKHYFPRTNIKLKTI